MSQKTNSTLAPILSAKANDPINIVCRCGRKLSWEACRDPRTGKIMLDVAMEVRGFEEAAAKLRIKSGRPFRRPFDM